MRSFCGVHLHNGWAEIYVALGLRSLAHGPSPPPRTKTVVQPASPWFEKAGLAVAGRYDLFQSISDVPNARFHTVRKRGNQEWATAL